MITNKKGLSTIVATLLIILLTLVAVGIIWVVVRNVVKGGTEQIDIDAKCLQANVLATAVNVNPADMNGNYSVTLTRQGGTDTLGGVKLVFMNDAGTASEVHDVDLTTTPLTPLATNTFKMNVSSITATKVTVVAYFLDASGNEQLCSSNQNPFEFA